MKELKSIIDNSKFMIVGCCYDFLPTEFLLTMIKDKILEGKTWVTWCSFKEKQEIWHRILPKFIDGVRIRHSDYLGLPTRFWEKENMLKVHKAIEMLYDKGFNLHCLDEMDLCYVYWDMCTGNVADAGYNDNLVIFDSFYEFIQKYGEEELDKLIENATEYKTKVIFLDKLQLPEYNKRLVWKMEDDFPYFNLVEKYFDTKIALYHITCDASDNTPCEIRVNQNKKRYRYNFVYEYRGEWTYAGGNS